jgi:hypothetical protein
MTPEKSGGPKVEGHECFIVIFIAVLRGFCLHPCSKNLRFHRVDGQVGSPRRRSTRRRVARVGRTHGTVFCVLECSCRARGSREPLMHRRAKVRIKSCRPAAQEFNGVRWRTVIQGHGRLPDTRALMQMRGLPIAARRCQAERSQNGCGENFISRSVSTRSTLPGRTAKIFLFLIIRKYVLLSPSRLSQRGASRSSRTLRRDAVGVSVLQRGCFPRRRTARCARSSRVVLASRR